MIINRILQSIYHPILHELRNFYSYKNLTKKINGLEKHEIISNKERLPRLFIICTSFHNEPTQKGGINRVTQNLITEINKISECYPVYLSEEGCCYSKTDEKVIFIKGDIILFLGIENSLPCYKNYLEILSKNGIKIVTFIHDLIPIRIPKASTTSSKRFRHFINTALSESNLIIANSNYVAHDIRNYIEHTKSLKKKLQDLSIKYTYLGANISNSYQSFAKNFISFPINFLMVSALVPRKKYDQAIKAFNILWQNGINVTFTIVGRAQKESNKIVKLIESNQYYNDKLFWRNGISDEELQLEYQKSDCILFTSSAEGFGLALYEAALYKRPLIIRDLEVFKEIASDGAFYFNDFNSKNLSKKITEWIELYKKDSHPKPIFNIQTWDKTALNILKFIEEIK